MQPLSCGLVSAGLTARGGRGAEPLPRPGLWEVRPQVRGMLMSRAGLGEVSTVKVVHTAGREPLEGKSAPWASTEQ